jgi:hypothetical protein
MFKKFDDDDALYCLLFLILFFVAVFLFGCRSFVCDFDCECQTDSRTFKNKKKSNIVVGGQSHLPCARMIVCVK